MEDQLHKTKSRQLDLVYLTNFIVVQVLLPILILPDASGYRVPSGLHAWRARKARFFFGQTYWPDTNSANTSLAACKVLRISSSV